MNAEYRKLGSFGIDGYVARVARLNGSEGINERIVGSKRLVGAARCCFLLAEQRPKRECQLLGVG